MRAHLSVALFSIGLGWSVSACNLVLGIEELTNEAGGGAGPEGGGGASTGGGGASTGGAGGDGGATGGGGASTGGGGASCEDPCPGTVEWAYAFGSDTTDIAARVAVGPQGNIGVVGEIGSTADFGGPSLVAGAFALGLNEDGQHVFSSSLADTSRPRLAVDAAANTFIAGSYGPAAPFGGGTGAFVLRLNTTGQTVLTRTIATSTGVAEIEALAAIPNGVVVVGSFRGNANFGGTTGMKTSAATGAGSDAFVWRLTSVGTEWLRTFSSSGASVNVARAVAIGESGNPIITGQKAGAVDFGDGTPVAGAGMFIVELDVDDGAFVRKAEPYGGAVGQSIAVSDDGASIAVGGFANQVVTIGTTTIQGNNAFVAAFPPMFDDNADVIFARELEGVRGVQVDAARGASHDIFISGFFLDQANAGGPVFDSAGGTDIFLARLTGTGGHVWSTQLGDMNDDAATGIAARNGSLLVTGTFASATAMFGESTLTSNGAEDVFVASVFE